MDDCQLYITMSVSLDAIFYSKNSKNEIENKLNSEKKTITFASYTRTKDNDNIILTI